MNHFRRLNSASAGNYRNEWKNYRTKCSISLHCYYSMNMHYHNYYEMTKWTIFPRKSIQNYLTSRVQIYNYQ